MRSARILIAGLGISLLVHGAGSAYFAEDPNEVSIAASQGGAVSVIGSIEDMVAGARVEAVEQDKRLEEIEPPEELVEPVQEPVEMEPVEQAVQPVVAPEKVQPVAMATPVEVAETTPVQPLKAVRPVAAATMVPVVAGMTRTDKVTEPVRAVATPETQTAKPVEVTPQEPVQIARAVQPEQQPVQEAVRPEADMLEAVPDAVRTPVAKPKPPVKKAEPVRKTPKKQQARRPQTKGGEVNTRKGGEQVTSKTARSNANGRANAKTNDGGIKAASNYKGKVVAKLRRAKKYPRAARRARLTGTARVAFTIARNGSVSGIRLSRSSGHTVLDQAALDMVRRASPMPKFPSDIKLVRMPLQVPVRFD